VASGASRSIPADPPSSAATVSRRTASRPRSVTAEISLANCAAKIAFRPSQLGVWIASAVRGSRGLAAHLDVADRALNISPWQFGDGAGIGSHA
jgi:hypothetical protein